MFRRVKYWVQRHTRKIKNGIKRKSVELKLKKCPEMDIIDRECWESFKDIPDNCDIFTFANHWAQLMERQMRRGKGIEEVAEKTSHEADIEYISGATYEASIHILVNCWKHGECLLSWHNNNVAHNLGIDPKIIESGKTISQVYNIRLYGDSE